MRRRNPAPPDCLNPGFDLSRVVYAPARPTLRQALEVEYEAFAEWRDSPRGERHFAASAWESLHARGVVPDAWLARADRRYWNPDSVGVSTDLTALPPSFGAVRTFGSDIAGQSEVEDLVREAARRLAPWGAPPLQRIVWMTIDPFQGTPGDRVPESPALNALVASLALDATRAGGGPGVRAFPPENALGRAMWLRAAANDYDGRVRRWTTVLQFRDARNRVRQVDIRALPNPITPVVEALCLGYNPLYVGQKVVEIMAPAAPYYRPGEAPWDRRPVVR